MQLRLLARTISASAALVFGIAAGAPAFAHGDAGPPPPPLMGGRALTVSELAQAAGLGKAGASAQVTRLEEAGHILAGRALVRDDVELIHGKVRNWIADPLVDVVISTGGTGLTGRDVTVEAFRALFEKEIDGFSAIFHLISYMTVGTSTV